MRQRWYKPEYQSWIHGWIMVNTTYPEGEKTVREARKALQDYALRFKLASSPHPENTRIRVVDTRELVIRGL